MRFRHSVAPSARNECLKSRPRLVDVNRQSHGDELQRADDRSPWHSTLSERKKKALADGDDLIGELDESN
jgi:hypothetical protein